MSMFAGKKCLVTGSAGMIGGNLVQRLIKEGAIVYAGYHNKLPVRYKDYEVPYEEFAMDLEHENSCIHACGDMDYVFHAAGKSYGASLQQENMLNLVSSNIKIHLNMLTAAHKVGVEKFIWFSSTTGYEDSTRIMKEDDYFLNSPADTYFGVGWMKRYTETLCQLFSEIINKKMLCIVPRLSSIVGPGDIFDEKKSHVFPALIKKIADGNNPLEIWGDGSDSRDFLYVDDMIDAIFMMVDKLDVFMPLNLCYGQSFSCTEIVRRGCNIEGVSPKIIYNLDKPKTLHIRNVSNEKIQNVIGWKPKTDIDNIIYNTLEWYKKHARSIPN